VAVTRRSDLVAGSAGMAVNPLSILLSVSAGRNSIWARRRAGLVMAVLGLLVVGCAQEQYTLRYGIEEIIPESLPRWPQEPEIPRYIYGGELTGEGNYVVVEGEAKTKVEEVFAWLVGLALPEGRPRRLQRPQGVMVDASGRILVTDPGQAAVFVFDEINGKLELWEQLSSFERFDTPIGISPGEGDEILVADAELGVLLRLSTDGVVLARLGEGLLDRPTGVTRDPVSGQIYVADTHGHDIKVFSRDDQLIETIGGRGEQPGLFNFPTHLAFHDGKLFVTDTMNTRVQVLDAEGNFLRTFGEAGLGIGSLVRPKGVSVDSDGNIYVIESYFDHLLVYNGSGSFLLPIGGEGGGPGQFYLPGGVWVDGRDRVFVADTFNGRISIFQYLGNG